MDRGPSYGYVHRFSTVAILRHVCLSATIRSTIRALLFNERSTWITYLDFLCAAYLFAPTYILMTNVSISL
jgi:hypothetical protein